MVGLWQRFVRWREARKAEIERERREFIRELDEYATQCREIEALTAEEAKQRFFAAVEAGVFEVEYAAAGCAPALLTELPDLERDLFSKMTRVMVKYTDEAIDRDLIQCWNDVPPGFLLLGTGVDGHDAVLVKPRQEGIYILLDGDALETLEDSDPMYPTIYHYLLVAAIR